MSNERMSEFPALHFLTVFSIFNAINKQRTMIIKLMVINQLGDKSQKDI